MSRDSVGRFSDQSSDVDHSIEQGATDTYRIVRFVAIYICNYI